MLDRNYHSRVLKAVAMAMAAEPSHSHHFLTVGTDNRWDRPVAEIAAETVLLTQRLGRAVRRNQHQPLASYLPNLEAANTATSKIPLASKIARTASFPSSQRRRKP